ncbi:MAG: GxxExxY protein [Chlorobiota bacterium]|nr:MAG: GxxExxY protein [Chlorobiota bacterium]
MENDELTSKIIGAAITVHRELGPGLLESTYEMCLMYELKLRGLNAVRQQELPVTYKGVNIDCGYRLDIVVENEVILELKSVDDLLPVHSAQLLTYMKLSGIHKGLLINFNEKVLHHGIKRKVL